MLANQSLINLENEKVSQIILSLLIFHTLQTTLPGGVSQLSLMVPCTVKFPSKKANLVEDTADLIEPVTAKMNCVPLARYCVPQHPASETIISTANVNSPIYHTEDGCCTSQQSN